MCGFDIGSHEEHHGDKGYFPECRNCANNPKTMVVSRHFAISVNLTREELIEHAVRITKLWIERILAFVHVIFTWFNLLGTSPPCNRSETLFRNRTLSQNDLAIQ